MEVGNVRFWEALLASSALVAHCALVAGHLCRIIRRMKIVGARSPHRRKTRARRMVCGLHVDPVEVAAGVRKLVFAIWVVFLCQPRLNLVFK